MSDEFPYRLHYAGATLRLNEEGARYIREAIEKATTERATILVRMSHLLAADPMTVFVIGPGIPIMLTGPAFTVTDIVDR